MRKRVLSIILALCMYASAIPSAYALQTDFSPQENPPAEEHTAELLHYADETRVPTYEEAHDAMMALQPELYEGRSWTNQNSGDYTWHGGPLDGNVRTGVGCVAFAFRLSDAAFGNLPARMYRKSSGPLNFSDVKVGDILRERNDSHTVIVTQVSEGGLILAEGNYNKSIHWGRPMDKDYFDANVTTWITRYPEGYIEPNDPTANEPVAGGTGTLVGGLNWKLTNAGTLTISGSGAMPDFETLDGAPWNKLNSSILKIVIDNGVTHVGNYAFYGSSALSVNLPNTVTSIGNGAFRKSSIVSMTIPNSVKTIGDDAFRECKNLDHMNIPEGVQSIGERAFQGCEAFTFVNLPASIQSVGAGAFYNCTKLVNVHFTPGETHTVSIGANTFTGCHMLMTITLPSKINRISPGMFTSCISLSYMIIPEGTTEIANTAFSSSGVSVVFIPTSIKYMGVEGDTPFGPGEGPGNPFAGCGIKDIYFAGTQAQWNAIQKAPAMQQTLATATVHYDFPHEHEWDAGVVTPPDGEDDGFTTYTCKFCGEIKRDIIPATDPGTDPDPGHTHTWDEGEVTTPATCTQEGVKTFTCTYSGCNETKTESIPALGHSYGEYTVKTPATCTEPGKQERTCNICGNLQEETISATGHSYGEYKETTPAACTQNGIETRTCENNCGATQSRVIPATGHDYVVTNTTSATCTEDGVETSTCSNCGDVQTEVIPATGHTFPGTPNDNGNYACQNDGCDVVVAPVLKDGYDAVQDIPLTSGTADKPYLIVDTIREYALGIVNKVLEGKSELSQCTLESITTIEYKAPTRTQKGWYIYTVTIQTAGQLSEQSVEPATELTTKPLRIDIPEVEDGFDDLTLLDDYANQYTAKIEWNGDRYKLSLTPINNTIPNPGKFIVCQATYDSGKKMIEAKNVTGSLNDQTGNLEFSGTAPRSTPTEVTYKLFVLDKGDEGKDFIPIMQPRVSPSIAQN